MKSQILLSLSILWLTQPQSPAQSAADFFHNGAVNYLSNNVPKALEVVTNGRARFPDDIKLTKLEELLKQQNQQQQQQQQDQQQQQAKQQEQPQAQQSPEEKKEGEQPEEQKGQEQQGSPGQMTPEEAKRMLDAQKGEEQVLPFQPESKPRDVRRPFKDW